MTRTGSETGARNADLLIPIKTRARAAAGWKAFDSTTGFRPPDNSVLSPDAPLWPSIAGRRSVPSSAAVSPPSAPIWR
jgi:Uma2 family endonuclease